MKNTSDIPIIVHEIKNLLAGISGAINVFFEDIAPDDPNKVIMAEILSQIDRLDKAVKELLSFIGPFVDDSQRGD